MLTGKRFRIGRGTLSVEMKESKPTAFTVPAGAVIEVISGPRNGDGMVHVMYEGRKLSMFAVDVKGRGTEISDPKGPMGGEAQPAAYNAS